MPVYLVNKNSPCKLAYLTPYTLTLLPNFLEICIQNVVFSASGCPVNQV